ncbi:restriction endonuclease subunit S [uncultured Megamonas sp.]|uniref:restriction endonuclease subunit S n=1 Tax=uncultured Megamonas sp. TaxID=286140 RepID=UPI0025E64132|nr:restriction endonuclease subunit S [uncultured Megamonas sp.]
MNVPKLRFKKFTDEWNFLPAEKLFSNINEKNFPNENVLTIIQGKGTVLREQSGRDIIFDESRKNTYKKVQRNDFIIHLRSFEAGLEIANSSGIVSPAYTILRNNIPIATMFYRNYFRSNRFINQILRKAVEGIRDGKQISYSQFKKLPIIYTSFDEQNKIANFLTTVDKKITNLENIITNLENQKKGLLQQIFSQKLRFKDKNGNNYPNWEKKKLGELFIFKQGYQIPAEKQFKIYKEGYLRYLYISDFLSNKNILYVKKDDMDTINKSDIAIANTGNTSGKFFRGQSGILSNNMFVIKNDEKFILNDFLFFYLETNLYDTQLKKIFNSSGQPHLGHKNMSNITIIYPQKQEQTKIADFLSAFDRKLDNQKAQLEHWKQIKKGLLQQMFV